MSDSDLSLRALIERAGKTQAQVAEDIGVDRTYLSQMVNGKVNWVNSSYFPALVQSLGLTFRHIEKLRPDAVTGMVSAAIKERLVAAQSDWAARQRALSGHDPAPRSLAPELAQMIEEKQALAPELATERWQQYLAGQRFSTGEASAERWWSAFLTLKNAGLGPGEN